jgi:5-methylcytosine-specific restriction protein A
MFAPRQSYRRRDLHATYGGQQQGGISTPAKHSIIFLITGESGTSYGYSDGWTEDGIFRYTGEGQSGDMTFTGGNRAVRDHVENGKDLFLFEDMKKGQLRFINQMVCTGYEEVEGPDREKKKRNAIVFELVPLDVFTEVSADSVDNDPTLQPPASQELAEISLKKLRALALSSGAKSGTAKEHKSRVWKRSEAVRIYVLRRADGICEGCDGPAPFKTSQGHPYLEPHHIKRLSDGGPDDPRVVIGICPNCHRRAHYGEDKVAYNSELLARVTAKEYASNPDQSAEA